MIHPILFVLCLCLASNVMAEEGISLFDGKSLDGWTKVGGGATYEVRDGAIVGKTGPGKNTFLTRGPFKNFVLDFEVKCDPKLNSGVQIRSHQYKEPTPQESKPDRIRQQGEVYGYQCEIRADINGDNGCAGNFWDEGRRTRWLDTSVKAAEAQKVYKPGEWNQFTITAKGNKISSSINGVPIAEFTDDRDAEGFIGLQVHAIKKDAGPFEVAWRNIRIKDLGD